MIRMQHQVGRVCGLGIALGLSVAGAATGPVRPQNPAAAPFHLHEATIEQIQHAIATQQITTVEVVKLYLARIKKYNGQCVREPEGILGPIETIPRAHQVNALGTLNLRPASRTALGFDDRKARTLTHAVDDSPTMPDALEVAAMQDRQFVQTGRLVGPLHGVVLAIKDQFDTFDMRSTRSNDVFFANDRPPDDATFVRRLRDAGAIVLAKANMSIRSTFGGTVCNPYDTERSPSASSSGAGAAVSANLVTCAIGEETGISIRGPAQAGSLIGLAPTQELNSRDGMIGAGINTRVGPMCRTVEDAARLLTVMAGYDPKDPLTVFSIGRKPSQPYESFAREVRLDGIRIGVAREYLEKGLFGNMDGQSIDIMNRAIGDLRSLGATIVDPGPNGSLFQSCINTHAPQALNTIVTARFPDRFPVDSEGKPTTNHIATLVEMAVNPSLVPAGLSLRDFGEAPAVGENNYWRERYLRERGDAAIKTAADENTKANTFKDPRFRGSRSDSGTTGKEPLALNMARRMLLRFAVQQVVLQCMAELNLDAVTYATSNVPPLKLGAPEELPVKGRETWHLNRGMFTLFGHEGFPVITVPAGFTTQVYDLEFNPSAPDMPRVVGPTPARLPVGIDFAGRPFDEPTLLRIASAYARATKHRVPPPDFGPLPGER